MRKEELALLQKGDEIDLLITGTPAQDSESNLHTVRIVGFSEGYVLVRSRRYSKTIAVPASKIVEARRLISGNIESIYKLM